MSTHAATVRRHLVWWAVAVVPLAFLGLFFLWPVASVLARGLLEDWDVAAAWEILTSSRTLDAIGTTLGLALAGTAGSLLVGLPASWALGRFEWRGRSAMRAVLTTPFVLPTIVVAAAFSALLSGSGILSGLGLDQTPASIVIALVFFNVSVIVRFVSTAWEALPPGLADAARTLGASRAQAYLRVTLPALAPAIASAAAVVFLFCSTSFALVLILGGSRVRTVETEIYLQVNQFLDLRAASVLALVQVAIVAFALWLSSRMGRARGFTQTVHGRRGPRRGERLAVGGALAPALVLLALPLGALVERSFRVGDGYGLDHYLALVATPARGVLPVPVWQAALNSVVTATIATLLAGIVGVTAAMLIAQRSRRGATLEALAMLPLGVSAVVVGLGLLLTLNRNVLGVDLRASWWLVPIAQAVVALPLLVRALVPAARAIEPRLRAAAASLGAPPWRVLLHVDGALLRPAIGAGLAFAFAIAMGEFGATAFVARPDRPTLTTAIARLLSRPGAENVGLAYASAVLLAVTVAAIMLMSERWRARAGSGL
ncbi:ABC transporter permease [Demequina zhanjiangensis]|uniref:Iron ABC transporter permease n=1 Tax=Demequina zhanjiangensis TaxID=3051659 RepID=A0ABT8G4L6_9MICO|nr:iron ABC transporter permease [Demequina sp. SYSU T00b26]MDN4474048.1 iron ABC transporter permease [Demequina sp. SYSU T00b26]